MIGTVRYTVKMERKVSMRIIVGGRKFLFFISLKSSSGERALFSIAINAASDAPDAAKRAAT
jgi:hypothetical protein